MARICKRTGKKYPCLACQISVIPAQEIDDLTQKLWLRLVANDCLLLRRFSGTTEEDVWIYLVMLAKSVMLDHYKNLSRKKRPQIRCSLDRLAETRADRLSSGLAAGHVNKDFEKAFFTKQLAEQLSVIVRDLYRDSSLADSNRAILIFDLYFRQGFTADEISQRKDINLSGRGVRKLISRLRGYLIQHVNTQGLDLGL